MFALADELSTHAISMTQTFDNRFVDGCGVAHIARAHRHDAWEVRNFAMAKSVRRFCSGKRGITFPHPQPIHFQGEIQQASPRNTRMQV
jgi:hypothetical protein